MKILVTAGPTREPIDAVRFISNRSSGKIGLAIAQAAVAGGHDTTLLLGPISEGLVEERGSGGYRLYRFGSSVELKQLIEAHWADQDVLIMAAAVSDYRPGCVAEGKLPRKIGESLNIILEPTPDLVSLATSNKRADQYVIAFALEESEDLETRAAAKLKRKGVDAIVANPLGTMESDQISAVWITRKGERETVDRMTKKRFAMWLIEKLESVMSRR